MEEENTSIFVKCLLVAGDDARNKLISHTNARLQRLAQKMLKKYPRVWHLEQTGDVHNSSVLRLKRALSKVRVMSSSHFWNLAALQIHRVLIDMARRHKRSPEQMVDETSDRIAGLNGSEGVVLRSLPGETIEPYSLEAWTRFHEQHT
jgi:hypothetical protein